MINFLINELLGPRGDPGMAQQDPRGGQEPSPGTNEHPRRAEIDLNTPSESSLQGLHAGDLKTAIALTKPCFISKKLYL